MPKHFVDPMEEIVINLQQKNKELKKELSDTKANLHRAYNGLENHKALKKENAALKESLRELIPLAEAYEHSQGRAFPNINTIIQEAKSLL